MSIIAENAKIDDISDLINRGRGFDISTPRYKKLAIRSPLFDKDKIDTDYTTHIDWLQLVITPEPGKYFDKAINENKADTVIDDLLQLFSELIPNQEWDDKPGKFHYGKIFYNKAVSSGQILINYTLPEDIPEHSSDKPSILISIPGSICQQLHFEQLLGLIAYFKSIGKAKFTRVDIALDDFTRAINYEMIRSAVVSGCMRGYRSLCNGIENLIPNIKNLRNGWSFTFGEKGDKELQIYDKQAESLGAIPSIRFEGRFRDDRAENLVNELMENFDYDNSFLHLYSPGNLPENFISEKVSMMAGAVNGCINFIEFGQEGIRLSRCKLMEWWANHLENTAKSIKIKLVSNPLTALPDKLFNMIRCAKSITKIKRFFDSAKSRIIDNEFTFESFINLLSCIGSGRINQADNLELMSWLDTWGNTSEKFDNLLEFAGVFSV